jgi:hypothetical protein
MENNLIGREHKNNLIGGQRIDRGNTNNLTAENKKK